MKKILLFFTLYVLTLNLYSQLTKQEIKNFIYYLSDDNKKGRDNGSKEMMEISEWLINKLRNYNIQPFFNDSTYIQRFSYTRSWIRKKIKERNIVGYYPCKSNPNANYLVISAHYDHIGLKRNKKDSICNGAADNASGVAAILGIAKYLNDKRINSKYHVVFAFYAGEEDGLMGSSCFANSLNIDKVEANFNFDMLGRCKELGTKKFYITGEDHSNLFTTLNKFCKNKKWKIKEIGRLSEFFYTMSDNFSIYKASHRKKRIVPNHTFAIGLMGREYLHKPNDEAKYLDFENIYGFTNFISKFTEYYITSEIKLKFIKTNQ